MKQMTPKEAQRQIAELLGWEEQGSDGWWTSPDNLPFAALPDWFNDANAAMTLFELMPDPGIWRDRKETGWRCTPSNHEAYFGVTICKAICRAFLEWRLGESIELIEEGEVDAD